MREGRESDALTFQRLHQRLQRSEVLQNREAILALFLNLCEAPRAPAYKKVAPFMPYRPPASSAAHQHRHLNGSKGGRPENGTSEEEEAAGVASAGGDNFFQQQQPGGSLSYLSSIRDIRHNLPSTSAVLAAGGAGGGYHPPVPPKPKSPVSLLKSRSAGEVRAAAAAAGGAKKDPVSLSRSKERPLLRELIYAFQGIEGTLVRRDRKLDRFCLAPSQVKNFSAPTVQICLRLAELGWLYNRVRRFCDRTSEDRDAGPTAQALVTGVRNELAEYYRLLSALEAQVSSSSECDADVSLHHLSVWTLEPTNRMKLLASVADACQGKRGGEIVSAVYEFLPHGDRASSDTVRALLTTACHPMYLMLLRWICDGTLEDPHGEFFVAVAPGVTGERLWGEKYRVREEMIPSFLTRDWVEKILATGKSINFLHEVCHDNSPISGRDVVKASLDETSPESLFSDPHGDSLLHRTIRRAFTDTSSHVLGILFTRYKFLEHMSALRKYLLLGQGDIIRYLLELLEEELGRPAAQLYPHNLAGVLETAIRATNAQFEDPEILERLDVRLLDVQPGDTGWDVFSLDYKMSGPVGTVFNQKTMTSYLMLFNALWRAKRIEWMLSCVWKRQAALHKMGKTIPELKPLLHIANLLTSEMVHFIHQLAYYITFEVMECSWDVLIQRLRGAESLDGVIEAHEEFLKTLLSKSLLDERSRELLTQLRAIYDIIIEFQGIQNKLYISAVAEVEER